MGTFLRYVVSTAFGIFSRAIWPFIAQPQRWVSSLHQHLFKQSFVFTDDCPVTSVNWGWKAPKQRQYKKSKNKRLHCLSLKHKAKKLNQMNDRVREKEKAELLPYKGNIWEGKVSFSIHQEARAWSRGHSFHERGAQHFRSPAAQFKPAHSTFKSSTFIYKREEKPAHKSKESYPRRAKQLNFFSSVTEKWGIDVPPWRDNTESPTTTALWSPER